MISVVEATQRIKDALPACQTEKAALTDVAGRILAQQVRADRDQPPFDRVMMDGIAIAHDAFVRGSTRFQRQGIQAAGSSRQVLADPGNCIEVMTGSVLPEGCDCVIPVEQIRLTTEYAELEIGTAVQKSQFIHPAGSDYCSGDVLLEPGACIGGPEIAVLASAGAASVTVASIPSIMTVAVGDELIDPETRPGPAQIRRSNDYAINGLLRLAGLDDNTCHKLPDDPEQLRTGIEEALQKHEIVVLTGGVSMGKYDYIPSIMNELGVEILLHKVAQKPGKPMWVGRGRDRMVFALPGNPVSAMVCARRYVVPALQTAMDYSAPIETARLAEPLTMHNRLTWFVPVTLRHHESGMLAEPHLPNTSGDFHALASTTGFIELTANVDEFPAGYCAPLWRW